MGCEVGYFVACPLAHLSISARFENYLEHVEKANSTGYRVFHTVLCYADGMLLCSNRCLNRIN